MTRLGLTPAAIPGLVLSAALAFAAMFISRQITAFPVSPMILAACLGMASAGAFGRLAWTAAGNGFILRRLLRLAIVLLGLQLTLGDLLGLGAGAAIVILTALVATFFFTRWLGGVMGVSPGLSELLAAGTAICGASAIVATNSVTRASQEDAIYAVVIISFFGSIAMFAFPALYQVLPLDPRAYGVWAGGSVHEVAQVVAAGFQAGQSEGEVAMVAKLLRVMAMAPMILALGFFAARRAGGEDNARPPAPWFVFGFLALVVINSIVAVPASVKQGAQWATVFMLTLSLAALGLETNWRKLREGGLKPLALGGAATLFIAVVCLLGVWLVR